MPTLSPPCRNAWITICSYPAIDGVIVGTVPGGTMTTSVSVRCGRRRMVVMTVSRRLNRATSDGAVPTLPAPGTTWYSPLTTVPASVNCIVYRMTRVDGLKATNSPRSVSADRSNCSTARVSRPRVTTKVPAEVVWAAQGAANTASRNNERIDDSKSGVWWG